MIGFSGYLKTNSLIFPTEKKTTPEIKLKWEEHACSLWFFYHPKVFYPQQCEIRAKINVYEIAFIGLLQGRAVNNSILTKVKLPTDSEIVNCDGLISTLRKKALTCEVITHITTVITYRNLCF